MAGLSGKDGSLTINNGAETICITNWTVNSAVELMEDTNSCSGGKATWVNGISSLTGSFNGHYDPDTSNIDSLVPGTTLTTNLFKTDGSGHDIAIATMIIDTLDLSLDVKAFVEFNVTFKGSGLTLSDVLTALET